MKAEIKHIGDLNLLTEQNLGIWFKSAFCFFHGGPTEKRHESTEGASSVSDSAATFDFLHFNHRGHGWASRRIS